ncbi:c-type cytochrome [Frigoriglobus tundricola]|uniref:Cytochrome c domain-containing protein n=1 Tax=Frigoriglobus tundricola TaxID=2774151 RepID=A0A6M5YVT8_9BACT|nr:hypothetical protein [Frigoriglobus tundricola]QJW97343.1 hypothetical protein FTUN_4914 [Frigoriglobus tundricola]
MRLATAAVLCATMILAACTKPNPPVDAPPPESNGTEPPPPTATNGLEGADRDRWYHLSQGSELYPYRFLQVLMLVDEQKPFIDNLDRYGFIPDAASAANPEGVPIGVTVAPTKDLAFAGIRMVGINCAACHTTVLEKDGKVVLRVDGGQNLFDVRGFLGGLAANTQKTFTDPRELLRFVSRLIENQNASPQATAFTTRLVGPGGDKLLKNVTTMDEFKQRGPVEEQVLRDVTKLIEAELKTPAPDLRKTTRTKSPDPVLKDYADKAPKFFGAVKWSEPDELKARAAVLRTEALGDPKSRIKKYDDLAKVPPGEKSPLHGQSEAERLSEITSGLSNVVETLRLLRARYDLLQGLIGSGGPALPSTDPLPGRVDAFGSARNTMFPAAPVPLTAPVNYPHLWNVTQTPWYHWDNNTNSELQRNVGEAIGVGVIYTAAFDSTVRIDHIIELEGLAAKIKVPVWPAAFGALDRTKADRGKALYAEKCTTCHQETKAGQRFEDRMYPLSEIETDPTRANNFALPMPPGTPGKFVDGLAPLLKNIIEKNGGPAQTTDHWRTTEKYGARPLDAVWASAPYLHNGSVRVRTAPPRREEAREVSGGHPGIRSQEPRLSDRGHLADGRGVRHVEDRELEPRSQWPQVRHGYERRSAVRPVGVPEESVNRSSAQDQRTRWS